MFFKIRQKKLTVAGIQQEYTAINFKELHKYFSSDSSDQVMWVYIKIFPF